MERTGLILSVLVLGVIWRISGQRQCPRPQKPWNGMIFGSCSTAVGSQCIFQCRTPYVLVGSKVRVCRADGTWSGSTAACDLDVCNNCGGGSNCPNLYNPLNGHTAGQCTPGIAGQPCQFFCNNGYALDGHYQLTCMNNGQWDSKTPVCTPKSAAMCEEIVVQNGRTTCTQEGGLTVCTITCEDTFMIVGSSVVTCSSSGDWSDQIPICKRYGIPETTNVCPTLVAPNGGRLVGSCTAANSGDTCQLVCLSGYRPSDTRVLVCLPNGRWSDTLPRCVGDPVGCPSISVRQGSTSGTCSPGAAGQTCTITCNSGYTLTGGSGTLVCQSNGQWSGTIPSCQALTCPALAPPVYGGVSGTCSPGQAGHTCTFYCNAGYQLMGQSTLVCGRDGRWSGNSPYCAGASCPNLNPPANGARSGSCTQASVGQSCTFSCQAGYTLNGQSTLYCQSGGTWSSSVPTCTRQACPPLGTPPNGAISGFCSQATAGQSCTFSCQAGYTLVGQPTLYCQDGGRWSSHAPSCTRSSVTPDGGSCPALHPPPNGVFVECDNRVGGQCVVVCEHGYVRSGSRVRTCLGQGMWSGYAPTCTRTVGYTTYKYKVVPLWTLIFG